MIEPGRSSPRRGDGWLTVVTVLGAVHALVVAGRYHVGSFDDDAGYLLAARTLASGGGLTTTLAAGYPLVGVYPPGYAAVSTPLALIWPDGVVPLRALCFVAFIAIFPLTWWYLDRRRVLPPVRLAVLGLLALSPVLATYATMVMPEMLFIVVFLGLLLTVERWQQQASFLTWAGAGTVAGAAGLLWLKEAGIGLVIGVAGWLVVRRLWRKALTAAVVPVLAFLPVVIARAQANVPLVGSRYSADLADNAHGGIAGLVHNVPHATWAYLADALPRSIVPTGVSPLPLDGPLSGLLAILQWTAAPLIVVGFVVWRRRHRDAASVAVPVYLLETLVYPFTNERRVVLVLPVIAAWYVLGAATLAGEIARWSRAGGRRPVAVGAVILPVVYALVAVVALAAQFPRDYLYSVGQDSSSPDGSRYMALLKRLGPPREVVETGYLWTAALASGHRSANAAYRSTCEPGAITRALAQDHAGYLLTAALNRPGQVDRPCVLTLAAAQPGAIRLYRTRVDLASVFELVGPGTGHPDLRDATPDAALSTSGPTTDHPEPPQACGDPAGRYQTVPQSPGGAVLTWSWSQPTRVTQVSLGGAAAEMSTSSVTVSADAGDGTWRTLAAAPGPVGDRGATPFLLVRFSTPEMVAGLRVTIVGTGNAEVHDIHVIGPHG